MRTIIVFTLLMVTTPTFAMVFLDKEHSEKLRKESKARKTTETSEKHTELSRLSALNGDTISPLALFASPLQPGGRGMTINWMNALRVAAPKLAKKLDKGRSLIDMWAQTQVDSDEEIRAMVNDDTPHANKTARKEWEAKLKALKKAKLEHYKAEGMKMAMEMGFK